MRLWTKKEINAHLDALKKSIAARKRDMLAAADEGGMQHVSAKELQCGAEQCEWAIQQIAKLREKIKKEDEIGKEEVKKSDEAE